jgi:hypothetical protein
MNCANDAQSLMYVDDQDADRAKIDVSERVTWDSGGAKEDTCARQGLCQKIRASREKADLIHDILITADWRVLWL